MWHIDRHSASSTKFTLLLDDSADEDTDAETAPADEDAETETADDDAEDATGVFKFLGGADSHAAIIATITSANNR